MNARSYKTVFSKRLGALVAVGEHASSQGKANGAGSGGGAGASGTLGYIAALTASFALVSLAWAAPAINALPTVGQVVQGAASMSQTASQMTINQGTQRAAINWQSFNIGAQAKVQVVQPNAQAVLLNRVVGQSPSQIFGKLQANGHVILVNPNGVLFGKDGSVNAGGFTASTLNISDANFMAGNMVYERNGSTAGIVNEGKISTEPGGYVALLGATVSNEGSITTKGGSVVMGAGETIKVPVSGTGRIKLELTPAAINASVSNSGSIVTEGGQVYMQALALNRAAAQILQSGSIDTTGEKGGEVHVLADGGQIRVSGSIKANSTDGTAGGDIYIGRDKDTNVLAAVGDASGAQIESKGGFVETSGQFLKVDNISVIAKDWLLDPTNIRIVSGTPSTETPSTSDAGAPPANTTFQDTTPVTESQIKNTTIQDALNQGTNVKISTGLGTSSAGTQDGNIIVGAAITKSSGGDAKLTLEANNGISFTNGSKIIGVSESGALNVVLKANGNAGQGANSFGVHLSENSGIETNGTIEIDATSRFTNGWLFTRSALAMQHRSILKGTDVAIDLKVDVPPSNRVYGLFAQNNTTIEATKGNLKIKSTLKGAAATANSIQFGSSYGPAVTVKASGNVTLISDTKDSTNAAGVSGISLVDTKLSAGGNVVIDSQVRDANVNAISSGRTEHGTSIVAGGSVTLTSNQGRIALGSLTSPVVGTAGLQGTDITITNGTGSTGTGIEGVWIGGGGNIRATTGAINITGKAESGVGVNVTNAMTAGGSVNVTGTSNGASTGANVSNITSTGGSVTVDGKSATGNGATTTWGSISAAGDVTITGTTAGAQRGVNTGNIDSAGLVKVTGTSNSGSAVLVSDIKGKDIAIVGNSTTGSVLEGSGALNATEGKVSITGATGNKDGYAITTNGTITATDDIEIKTTSAAKHGISLGGTIDSTNGAVTIYADLLPNGEVGISGNHAIKAKKDVTITGKSKGFYSVNGLGAIESTEGKVTIDATSTNSSALRLTNAVKAKGDVLIKGTGGNDSGINTAATTTVTSTDGNVTFVGKTTGQGIGINFSGTTTINAANGTFEATAESAAQQGLAFSGTTAVNARTYTINAEAKGGAAGIYQGSGTTSFTSTAGDSSIKGKSDSGRGVFVQNGTLDFNANNGSTATFSSGKGEMRLGFGGGPTVNTNGNVSLGSDQSGFFSQADTNVNSGTLTIRGKSAGHGVAIQDGSSNSTDILLKNGSSLVIVGESTGSGSGIHLLPVGVANKIEMTGQDINTQLKGSITMTGVSAAGVGISTGSTPITSDGGNITLTGTSNGTNGTGLSLSGPIRSGDSTSGGTVTLTGTANGTGSSVAINHTGTVQGGSVEMTGVAKGTNNAIFSTGTITATAGAATIKGTNENTAANGGGGVTLRGVVKAKNDVNLEGYSAGGTSQGLVIQNAVESTEGNINVTGETKSATQRAVAINAFSGTVIGSLKVADDKKITINANTLLLDGAATVLDAGANGTVNIKTRNNNQIVIGGNTTNDGMAAALADQKLGIDQTELNRIKAGSLMIGDIASKGKITVEGDTATAAATGNLTLQTGGEIAINKSLTVGSITERKNLDLKAGGEQITQAVNATITANQLTIQAAQASVALAAAANQVNQLAANVKSLDFKNGKALQIGVGNARITASGRIKVETTTGNLNLNQAVTSSAQNVTDAVTLIADANKNAGDSDGGNIIKGIDGLISVGDGSTAKLYTGAIDGSTGMQALAGGAGSGRYRYNSDESVSGTNFSKALEAGVNVIYREAPEVTVKVNDVNKVYDGVAHSGGAFSSASTADGVKNGDADALVGSNAVFSGNAQGVKDVLASVGKTISALDNGKNALGYKVTYKEGNLSITPRPLTIAPGSVGTKTADGNTTAVVTPGTLSNLVGTETLGVAATGTFSDANPGNNKAVNAFYTLQNGANGGVVSNYVLNLGTPANPDTRMTGNILASVNPVTPIAPVNNNTGSVSRVRTVSGFGNSGAATGVLDDTPVTESREVCSDVFPENCECQPSVIPSIEICFAPKSVAATKEEK